MSESTPADRADRLGLGLRIWAAAAVLAISVSGLLAVTLDDPPDILIRRFVLLPGAPSMASYRAEMIGLIGLAALCLVTAWLPGRVGRMAVVVLALATIGVVVGNANTGPVDLPDGYGLATVVLTQPGAMATWAVLAFVVVAALSALIRQTRTSAVTAVALGLTAVGAALAIVVLIAPYHPLRVAG